MRGREAFPVDKETEATTTALMIENRLDLLFFNAVFSDDRRRGVEGAGRE